MKIYFSNLTFHARPPIIPIKYAPRVGRTVISKSNTNASTTDIRSSKRISDVTFSNGLFSMVVCYIIIHDFVIFSVIYC